MPGISPTASTAQPPMGATLHLKVGSAAALIRSSFSAFGNAPNWSDCSHLTQRYNAPRPAAQPLFPDNRLIRTVMCANMRLILGLEKR
ncbi:conserved protein of unknown function [Pseudomonas marincola]|uniref:Uncharacterized protein n=1 Tax=Pseudomonas marincola TaxID=437900 RepID=A0A653DY16_9PSED|nr:conserved protein of unknown function [Pseudomonas marincola]